MVLGAGKCVDVCPCTQTARRFVLRDMGNGVDRIEMPELIPLEAAKEEAGLHGRTALPMQTCMRIVDACSVALPTGCSDCSDCIQAGFVRAIDEYAIELILWRRI